jgi:hypothetical protein
MGTKDNSRIALCKDGQDIADSKTLLFTGREPMPKVMKEYPDRGALKAPLATPLPIEASTARFILRKRDQGWR